MSYTKTHLFNEKVAKRIGDYMRFYNCSIKETAKKAGLSYQQLYQVIKRNQLIKLETYANICTALGVPFDAFLNDDYLLSTISGKEDNND